MSGDDDDPESDARRGELALKMKTAPPPSMYRLAVGPAAVNRKLSIMRSMSPLSVTEVYQLEHSARFLQGLLGRRHVCAERIGGSRAALPERAYCRSVQRGSAEQLMSRGRADHWSAGIGIHDLDHRPRRLRVKGFIGHEQRCSRCQYSIEPGREIGRQFDSATAVGSTWYPPPKCPGTPILNHRNLVGSGT